MDAPAVSGDCADILSHNRRGLLSYDATHLVKIFAAYTYPFSFMSLTAAPSFTFSSGLPYQQQQTFNIHGDTDVYYYTKKGSSRLPNWYQVNFALEADFRVFNPVQVGIKGEVFNLTNQQPVTNGVNLLPERGLRHATGTQFAQSAAQLPVQRDREVLVSSPLAGLRFAGAPLSCVLRGRHSETFQHTFGTKPAPGRTNTAAGRP